MHIAWIIYGLRLNAIICDIIYVVERNNKLSLYLFYLFMRSYINEEYSINLGKLFKRLP